VQCDTSLHRALHEVSQTLRRILPMSFELVASTLCWTKECDPAGRSLYRLNCALPAISTWPTRPTNGAAHASAAHASAAHAHARNGSLAPLQFSVLAAPVSTGRPSTSYTLTDPIASPPPRAAAAFTERLVLFPASAYPFAHGTWATKGSDHLSVSPSPSTSPGRPPSPSHLYTLPTRREQHLPPASFVFASFVQRWKLNPLSWPVWMNILRRAPITVLWVLQHALDPPPQSSPQPSPYSEPPLTPPLSPGPPPRTKPGPTATSLSATPPPSAERAAARPLAGLSAMLALEMGDVHTRRLVVMRRQPLEQHVMRTGLADLTLDTHPYSAHTTAADSLWMRGPPWLALCIGDRFDSRLSTSVLANIAAADSSAQSLRAFEDMAIGLAVGKT